MNSIKNTFVAVLLLGASYGVYQAITTPDPSMEAEADLFDEVAIEPGTPSSDFVDSTFATVPSEPAAGQTLPPQLPPQMNEQRPELASNLSPQFNPASSSEPTREAASSTFEPPTTFSPDRSVQQATGGDFKNTAEPIADSAAMGQPHDHALIAALKKVTEEKQFQPASHPISSASSAGLDGTSPRVPDFEFMKTCSNLSTQNLLESWPAIHRMVDEGRFREALEALSRFYYSGNITGPQRQKMMGWLNALSGKVIYSSEHHFRSEPYFVRDHDSLQNLATNWGIPAQLIYNINQKAIANPSQLAPGTELKVVIGPFNAEIDRTEKTLTLFVKRMYAGQFSLTMSEVPGPAGIQKVASKSNGNGASFGPPSYEIRLANGMTFKSLTERTGNDIGLDQKEIADLYSILGETSHVKIR